MLTANKVFIANKVDGIKNSNKLIEKFVKLKIRKLFKSKKLKSKKLSKSQNLAKLEKKLSKNRNLPNFGIKKARSSFLTFDAKMVFNYL